MAISIGIGTTGFSLDSRSKGAQSNSIENAIKRLEQQRDEYRKQQSELRTDVIDKKLKEVEDKIENLHSRLEKLQEKENGECETCKNRKYQDGSDDPGVSFKTASKITGNAETAVRGHEYEHVNRNRAKAEREDKEIVYQSVIIKRAICPECGKSYVSGGQTTTVTKGKDGKAFEVGLEDKEGEIGDLLDAVA